MKKLLMLLLFMAAVPAQAAGVGGMFGQGSTQFSLIAGNAYAFNHDYTVIGASASHYVLDGLGLGLSVENWSGGDPAINNVSPLVQYVFNRTSTLQPYIGGFYRHTSIAGLPSLNSLGERAGVYIISGTNSAVSVGLVHESYLDCNEAIYRNCSATYSDVSINFVF